MIFPCGDLFTHLPTYLPKLIPIPIGDNEEIVQVLKSLTMALTQRGLPKLLINSSSYIRNPSRLSQSQYRMISLKSYIITPKELSDELTKNVPTKISTAPRVIPICASWFMPNDPQGRSGLKTFKEQRIPSARFFDLDAIKDHESPYPHMVPTSEEFAKAMRAMRIRKDDTLVVYDSKELGIFSAPRVAWTLKVFSHPAVHILNNFRLWVEQGYPTKSGESDDDFGEPSEYPVPEMKPGLVASFAEVKEIAKDHGKDGAEGIQILDARARGRWAGTEPEPRPGIPSGHMPGSINVPFSELLDPVTKAFLPGEDLRKIFESKGIDPRTPIINSCASGVTAVIVDAALGEAGFGDPSHKKVYDGSWTLVFAREKTVYLR